MDMAHSLRIFTGRYSDPAIAGAGLVPLGITRYRPRFPLPYALKANVSALAPSAALLARAKSGAVTPAQFDAEYVRGLERVGTAEILRQLASLQGTAAGVILLCFENVLIGERCHRLTLASWLERRAGIKVDEFTTPALPRAIGYVRRSHESTERTVSLAAQRAAIERYAREQGWHLAAVVQHDGISGARRSRYVDLDAAVTAHHARFVIAYHLDRVGRDVAGLMDWVASAAKRGVELHIVGRGKMETASSSGYLGVGVEALVAAHFRLVVGEKTRGSLAHLRSAGRRWTRVAPFGFGWKGGQCVPDLAEQAVVARARSLRAAGLSLRKVSAALAAEGMLGRAGRPLSAETVNSIVRANVDRA